LVAYQPQQALPPGDWSGAQMTSSSSYTNPANPMAAATANDQSLQDIIDQYPPVWDGFLQLRMYLSTADKQAFTLHYPTLDIQVTGTTWRAVGGSPVNCASGTAVSIESVLLPSSTTTTSTTVAAAAPPPAATPTTAASGSGKGAAVGATPASDAKSSPGRDTPAGSAQASGSGTALATTQTSDFPVVLGSAVAVLVVLAAAVVLVRRRRRLTPEPSASGSSHDSSSPISSPTSSSSTKGDTP
jgi:membrane protein implicated in regulation of membrane protease activity